MDILEKLSEWPPEQISHNLDSILPELLDRLSNGDKGQVLQSVHALLDTCLPSVPLIDVESKVLCHAMPAAQQLFTESFEAIKVKLDDACHFDIDDFVDTLSSLLQVCFELLKCLDSVLLYVISKQKVAVSDVRSVPITVVSAMFETFKHCKESETLYGNTFSDVADVLNIVFRQCHQVQCHYFEVVTLHINWNCSLEDDVSLLVEILQVLSKVGEQIMGLDIKSVAEQWRGFTKLVQQYLEPLRERLDVSYPLSYLCQEVGRNLEQLAKLALTTDSRVVSKHLKTTAFVVKIVVKLCELFGSGADSLGNCYSDLLRLLLDLHRHSPPCLSNDTECSFIEEIERHLTIAADPLLVHLIGEKNFREEYFQCYRKITISSRDHLPFILLTLAVMKKLVNASPELRDEWLGQDINMNVVGCLFGCVKLSHLELCSDIYVPAVVKPGESPRTCDLYEALVCHCAALVLSSNASQFSVLETIFLDVLFDSSFWAAMLAGDVWCVCARTGSADLNLDLALYLAELVSDLAADNVSGKLESSYVALFLHRMCSLLGSKGKQTLFEQYPVTEYPHMWKIIGFENLPKGLEESSEHMLVSHAKSCIAKFLDNGSNVAVFKEMFYSLYGLSAALDAQSSMLKGDLYHGVSASITSLWAHISKDCFRHSSSENPYHCGRWFLKFAEILCSCTEHLIQKMSNEQILQVFEQLEGIVKLTTVPIKLSSLKILRGLATKVLNPSPDQPTLCSFIARLFEMLLQDSNPLVKEMSLETFEYFAHFTAHESIVAEAVIESKVVQDLVSQYVQREPPSSSAERLSFQQYLTLQRTVTLTHKCQEMKRKLPENPIKKSRLEETSDLSDFLEDDLLNEIVQKDVLDAINRICQDAQIITSSSSCKSIPESSQASLKRATENLVKFLNVKF